LGISGKHVILPSSYKGSPRDNIQRYCDSMAMVRELGKPSYFITMTCNPKWPEVLQALPPGLKAHECPDILARVFKMKLDALLKDLLKNKVMGKVIGDVYVIEFQKRGLPHAHILLIIDEKDRPRTADQYDHVVTAELSDDPEIRKLQTEFMIHGCGKRCYKEGSDVCSKGYPKPFNEQTTHGTDTYPNYRRRSPADGGQTSMKNGRVVTNQDVVPHNIFLLKKYNCHINVEICHSVGGTKYMYKYVYKGPDRVMYKTKERQESLDNEPDHPGVRGPARDEIKEFVDARYCSTSEACWHTLEFKMGNQHPKVQRMAVHMPQEHTILYTADEEETREALRRNIETQLTAFFTICQQEYSMYTSRGLEVPPRILYGGPPAQELLYRDVPKWYTWDGGNSNGNRGPIRDGSWSHRKQPNPRKIGRVRHIAPTMECKELFHLRLCLNVQPGPRSFENLRTVNGIVHKNYHEAAFALGLVEDDREWFLAMEESSVVAMPCQIRSLFVIILTHGQPMDPRSLWDKYKDDMSMDFMHKRVRNTPGTTDRTVLPVDHNYALLDIQSQLQPFPKNQMSDYHLPTPTAPPVPTEEESASQFSEVREHLSIDKDVEKGTFEELLEKLTDEQTEAFNKINQSVIDTDGQCYFLNGAGGCGKTTVAKTLIYTLRDHGDK